MAAVTLSYNTPVQNTSESTANKVRRVVMPSSYSHLYLRVYCATADCYVERGDVTDAASLGSNYETVPQGTQRWIYIGRGECGVACASASQAVELTAVSEEGI